MAALAWMLILAGFGLGLRLGVKQALQLIAAEQAALERGDNSCD